MLIELAITCLLCLIYFICEILKFEKERKIRKFPPGPIELPLIGGTIQIFFASGFKGPYWQRFHRVAEKYGKTFGVRVGALQTAYTEDFETIKDVLNSPHWTNRFPNHARFKEPMLGQNLGVIWSASESQKPIRKFIIRTLRTFGFGEMKSAETFLQEELFELFKFVDEKRSNSDQNEIYMEHVLKVPTLNILWRVMAGCRFSYDDPKLKKLIAAVDDISKINIGLDPEWSFPILRYIPGCSPSRAKRPSFVTCHQFMSEIKIQRRQTQKYNEIQNDFIDYFLHKIDAEKNTPGTIYNDDQFQVTCVDLLFGGLDTTVNSIEFGILYMTRFQDVQVKVQNEIDQVTGPTRQITGSDRAKLVYCEAVMWETFRWSNIVPIVARSNSTTHAAIGGYNVKKDTLCALNLTAVHFSHEFWEDPQEFRPDRFLNSENKIVNTEKVISFGGGKRGCPGYSMARVTWLTFFCALLQRYNFQPSPKNPQISTEPRYGIANSPKPFYCIVTPRRNL